MNQYKHATNTIVTTKVFIDTHITYGWGVSKLSTNIALWMVPY